MGRLCFTPFTPLDPRPIFSYQDHIYFKAAMTDTIELGNDLIDCLIQV